MHCLEICGSGAGGKGNGLKIKDCLDYNILAHKAPDTRQSLGFCIKLTQMLEHLYFLLPLFNFKRASLLQSSG